VIGAVQRPSLEQRRPTSGRGVGARHIVHGPARDLPVAALVELAQELFERQERAQELLPARVEPAAAHVELPQRTGKAVAGSGSVAARPLVDHCLPRFHTCLRGVSRGLRRRHGEQRAVGGSAAAGGWRPWRAASVPRL
jgi:hypothetical protein